MTKHLREIQKIADEFDREVTRRRGGHLALICRQGQRPPVFTSVTPGDRRTKQNLIKHLKAMDHEIGNPGQTAG